MDLVCDGGYEFVGSGGAYGGVSVNVESSHHLFSPIIDGKIQPINEKNDYECIKKVVYTNRLLPIHCQFITYLFQVFRCSFQILMISWHVDVDGIWMINKCNQIYESSYQN